MRKNIPSKNARKVALNIVTLGVKPGMDKVLPPHISDTTAELLIASGVATEKIIRFAKNKKAVAIYEVFDWMLPGQFEAFAYRKAFCERQVRAGITGGAAQILVLGAGYDTMSWRLAPEFASVRFFEIDRLATASLKAKGIEVMGRRDNLCLINEDLSKEKLVDVLEANDSWDSKKQTVIIAEGLLQYLPPEAVDDLFKQCAAISGPGSRIAFTYIVTGANGRIDAGPWTSLVLWILKVTGEHWIWSVRPEKLPEFLKNRGWVNAPELVGEINKYGVEFHGVATK